MSINTHKQKLIIILAAAAAASCTGNGNDLATQGASGENDIALENTLRQASDRVNRQLPMMIDRDTRADSTITGPGKKWTYLYTLVSLDSAEVTEQQLKETLASNLKNGVCTAKETRFFSDNGVTIVYKFRGKDGGMIGDVTIVPSECP